MDDQKKARLSDIMEKHRSILAQQEAARLESEKRKASVTPTDGYLGLVEMLASKNQLSPEDLSKIAASPAPIDPTELASSRPGLSPEGKYAFGKAFATLARKGIEWPQVQERLTEMASEALLEHSTRNQARIETAPLEILRSAGGLWCGLFEHEGWFAHFRVPDLSFAYRGPSLFLSAFRKAKGQVAFLYADEQATEACFGPTIHQATVAYVCTHGKCPETGYQAYLHRGLWQPSKTRFSGDRPIVIAFDTCNLIETSHSWERSWADTLRGGSVRLLLGFQDLTSIDPASSLRGTAFAENLLTPKSMAYADAWIDAVRVHAVTTDSHAIAIGVGNSAADAEAMLHLTFEDSVIPTMVPRLGTGPIWFAVKDLDETKLPSTPY